MPSREEALRRILDVAAAGRLTDEQRRELGAHLDDAVEARVREGVPEVEAVARALQDLGDVGKLAGRFPAPPAAVTPEGALWRSWSLEVGYLLFIAFGAILTFVLPGFTEPLAELRVAMPAVTVVFLEAARTAHGLWPWTIPLVLAVGVGVLRLRRSRHRAWAGLTLWTVSTALLLASLWAVALPFSQVLGGLGGP